MPDLKLNFKNVGPIRLMPLDTSSLFLPFGRPIADYLRGQAGNRNGTRALLKQGAIEFLPIIRWNEFTSQGLRTTGFDGLETAEGSLPALSAAVAEAAKPADPGVAGFLPFEFPTFATAKDPAQAKSSPSIAPEDLPISKPRISSLPLRPRMTFGPPPAAKAKPVPPPAPKPVVVAPSVSKPGPAAVAPPKPGPAATVKPAATVAPAAPTKVSAPPASQPKPVTVIPPAPRPSIVSTPSPRVTLPQTAPPVVSAPAARAPEAAPVSTPKPSAAPAGPKITTPAPPSTRAPEQSPIVSPAPKPVPPVAAPAQPKPGPTVVVASPPAAPPPVAKAPAPTPPPSRPPSPTVASPKLPAPPVPAAAAPPAPSPVEPVVRQKPAEPVAPKPAATESSTTTLFEPHLTMGDEAESGSFLSRIPMPVKIGLAILLLVAALYFVLGKSQAPVASAPVAVGEQGWSTEWAGDAVGSRRGRQLTLYRPSVGMTDYQMQFSGQIESKALGWVFREADTKNYYAMKIENLRPGAMAISHFAVVEGRESSDSQKPLGIDARPGATYRVKLDVQGPRFTVYIADEPVDFWTDNRLKVGAVGFMNERDERGAASSLQFSFARGAK